MDARRKTIPCVALALAALLAGGGEASASAYYSVTNLGPGWDIYGTVDDQGRTFLNNSTTKATMPFEYNTLDGPMDASRLPEAAGYRGTNQVPTNYPMINPRANDQGTVIGSYPDGSSLGTPYVSRVYGYVIRQADGGYGTFVPLASGPNESILLNDRDQIIYGRSKIYDIATGTTSNISDLISPEDIAKLGPSASISGLYWGTSFGKDGSILARLQATSQGEVTLLLTPPTLLLTSPTQAPEPSTLALLLAAGAGVAYRRYRRG